MQAIAFLKVPYGYGGPCVGPALGPEALQEQGFLTVHNRAEYSVNVYNTLISIPERRPLSSKEKKSPVKNYEMVTKIQKKSYEQCQEILENKMFPCTIGGDHSIAAGPILACNNFYKHQGKNIIVLWFDAHADFNTPMTSPTGNLHGMPVSLLCGDLPETLKEIVPTSRPLNQEQFVHIGLRDVDPEEKKRLEASRIQYFYMPIIRKKGLDSIIHNVLNSLGREDRIYISFDVDALDPMIAPGVSTSAPNGLLLEETKKALQQLACSKKVIGIDVCELNPLKDKENQTTKLVKNLINMFFKHWRPSC